MLTGMQRLARQQIDRATAPTPFAELEQATVTVVSGATPPVLTVKFRGGTYQFPHLLAYSSPAVNDVVAMARYAGSWLILGRPGGFP